MNGHSETRHCTLPDVISVEFLDLSIVLLGTMCTYVSSCKISGAVEDRHTMLASRALIPFNMSQLMIHSPAIDTSHVDAQHEMERY